ncbi:24268_t:CDS:2, partial [Dentiscutata erythropus]
MDELYLNTKDDQELLEVLADQAQNPDYDYIAKLFQQYHSKMLGGFNSEIIFEQLEELVNNYNRWEMVNADCIQRLDMSNEFLVPSTKQDTDIIYTINSEIGTCNCFV